MATLVFFGIIKAVMGLRVSEEEEMEGVDQGEHGMPAYGDFVAASGVRETACVSRPLAGQRGGHSCDG